MSHDIFQLRLKHVKNPLVLPGILIILLSGLIFPFVSYADIHLVSTKPTVPENISIPVTSKLAAKEVRESKKSPAADESSIISIKKQDPVPQKIGFPKQKDITPDGTDIFKTEDINKIYQEFFRNIQEFNKINIDISPNNPIEKTISFQKGMIKLEDLDFGKYGGMLIKNSDKSYSGFLHIPLVWGIGFKPSETFEKGMLNLSEAVIKYTGITCGIDKAIFLSEKTLKRSPVIIVTADEAFELTQTEKAGLREYLNNGGFLVVDNPLASREYGKVEAAMRKMLKEVIPNARFVPIPTDHEIYRCCHEFPDGPPTGSETEWFSVSERIYTAGSNAAYDVLLPEKVITLEGIWIENRLAVIFG